MDWFLPYPQFQFLGYLVQFIPVDTIPSPSQQPRQVSLLHSAPLIAVLRLDDVLVHSPREPYKFLLRAVFLCAVCQESRWRGSRLVSLPSSLLRLRWPRRKIQGRPRARLVRDQTLECVALSMESTKSSRRDAGPKLGSW